MGTLSAYCKKMIKKVVDYRIEDGVKIYSVRRTPFRLTYSLNKVYEKKWADCPVENHKIVFDNYMGRGYGCNGKYVTEELLKRSEDWDIVWTVKEKDRRRHEFPKNVRLVEYGSKEAFAEYASAKFWVGNYHLVAYLNRGLKKKAEQCYIQMWHGSFGIKRIENDCGLLTADKNWAYLAKQNSEYTDYWISNSGYETQVYQDSFWNVQNILSYGHPRNDLFFISDSEAVGQKVRDYFGIADKKIMLYVPTYRDNGEVEQIYPDYSMILESLRRRFGGDWILLIRLHPRMAKETSLMQQGEDILDATDYPDIQELLACADSVLTDYSSSVFDYLLTGRPAFLFVSDSESYEQERGLYYPLHETPFLIAADNEELKQNILSFKEEVYQGKVRAFLVEKESYEDGHASKRVADLIEKIGKKEIV